MGGCLVPPVLVSAELVVSGCECVIEVTSVFRLLISVQSAGSGIDICVPSNVSLPLCVSVELPVSIALSDSVLSVNEMAVCSGALC